MLMDEKKEVSRFVWMDDEKSKEDSHFAFTLLWHCTRNMKVDQNVVISPASIWTAMTMAGVGSAGKTMHEFKKVFGKDFASQAWRKASALAGIGGQMLIANAIFANGAVRSEFIKLLAEDFKAEVRQDLRKESINKWCAEKTKGMIKDLLTKELDPLDLAVILSVVYLKARWASKFNKSRSYKGKFNKIHDVFYMKQTFKKALYLQNKTFQAIALPYEGGKLEMVIVLPMQGTDTGKIIQELTGVGFDCHRRNFVKQHVILSLPRMKLEYGISVKGALKNMGLILPFDRDLAEFPKVCEKPVFISDVIHKAVMEVDEEGTVAAAATAVKMRSRSARRVRSPIAMIVDRQFVVILQTTQDHIPLFLALVNKPM